jgi:hypothetical protein
MKRRLLIAPLLAALLATAVLVAPAAEAATPACSSSGLVIWAGEEAGGGTAGSVFYRIEMTNLSDHSCKVSGYPKVNAVNLQGKRIGAPANHEPGKKAHTVKLAPGATATATLRIVDALNFPKNQCKPDPRGRPADQRAGRLRQQDRPARLRGLRPDEVKDARGERHHRRLTFAGLAGRAENSSHG